MPGKHLGVCWNPLNWWDCCVDILWKVAPVVNISKYFGKENRVYNLLFNTPQEHCASHVNRLPRQRNWNPERTRWEVSGMGRVIVKLCKDPCIRRGNFYRDSEVFMLSNKVPRKSPQGYGVVLFKQHDLKSEADVKNQGKEEPPSFKAEMFGTLRQKKKTDKKERAERGYNSCQSTCKVRWTV